MDTLTAELTKPPEPASPSEPMEKKEKKPRAKMIGPANKKRERPAEKPYLETLLENIYKDK
jgi:hypothetical protein